MSARPAPSPRRRPPSIARPCDAGSVRGGNTARFHDPAGGAFPRDAERRPARWAPCRRLFAGRRAARPRGRHPLRPDPAIGPRPRGHAGLAPRNGLGPASPHRAARGARRHGTPVRGGRPRRRCLARPPRGARPHRPAHDPHAADPRLGRGRAPRHRGGRARRPAQPQIRGASAGRDIAGRCLAPLGRTRDADRRTRHRGRGLDADRAPRHGRFRSLLAHHPRFPRCRHHAIPADPRRHGARRRRHPSDAADRGRGESA